MPPNIQFGIPDHIVPYGGTIPPGAHPVAPGSNYRMPDGEREAEDDARAKWFMIDNSGTCILLQDLMPASTPQQAEFLIQQSGIMGPNVGLKLMGYKQHAARIYDKNNHHAPLYLTNQRVSCSAIIMNGQIIR